MQLFGVNILCNIVVDGLMVKCRWSERMSVVIDVDQEVPVSLTGGGLVDSSHVVKNNRYVCRIGVCVLYSLLKFL